LRGSGLGALRVLGGKLNASNLRTVGNVVITRGSTAEIFDSEFEPLGALDIGIDVSSDSYLAIFGSTIANFQHGIRVVQSAIDMGNTDLTGNEAGGVRLEQGSAAQFNDVNIADNVGPGIDVRDNSTMTLFSGVLDGNSVGVSVSGSSHLRLGAVRIQDSVDGSGVVLADSSSVEAFTRDGAGDLRITGNSGWGIECAPAPQVSQLTGNAIDATTVSGNGLGQVTCPGF
jgi:hypothetical protein